MRLFYLWASLAFVHCAFGQTYINVPLANTNSYDATNSIDVPTNTLFQVVGVFSPQSISFSIYVTYDSFPEMRAQYPFDNGYSKPLPIVGPAKVKLVASAGTNMPSMCLIKLEPVNSTPMLNGFAVQAPNNSATINLETSTNLSIWTTATNGTYEATNQARFFRMNMTFSK